MPTTDGGPAPMSWPRDRLDGLRAWLRRVRPDLTADPVPASSDASFRAYYRVKAGTTSLIAMDAPPQQEDSRPFVAVAELLAEAGLNAPRILAADLDQGFLLLTDLGRETYLDRVIEHPGEADALYTDALAALVRWQSASRPGILPSYDEDLLRRELGLFPDWYVRRHLGFTIDDAWQADWDETCRVLVDSALAQPTVFVHRDFTPRNLMVDPPRPGILDFQDAVYGPVTYDLVSLLRDAFVSWPVATEAGWLAYYRELAIEAGLPVETTEQAFQRSVDLMAVQRHLKVIGIFARLHHRDGKAGYLDDVPRFFAYLRCEMTPYPELLPLRRLLAALPPAEAA